MEFQVLAKSFEEIEAASSRLDMTDLLSGLFKKTPKEDVRQVVYLCQGKLASSYEGVEAGLGEKLIAEAISKVSGFSRKEIDKMFLEKGDLGIVAQDIISKKKQSSLFREKLSVEKVYANLMKIAQAEGSGSQEMKLKLMAELFNSSAPNEAKYIARFPLGNMRLGIGDPTIMDAFAINYLDELKKDKKLVKEVEEKLKEKKAEKRKEEFERKLKMRLREKIEAAYNIFPDLGKIGMLLKEKGIKDLEKVSITPGVPIRPTLAERLPSAEEIIKKLGMCAVEHKYDGFRVGVHKQGNAVKIFSRNMEDMTHMFPDVVNAVRTQIKVKDVIFEGEALAFNEQTQEYLPFQITIQRKRKYGIGKMAEEFPLKLFVFDIMFAEGRNLMGLPFMERRKKLEKIVGEGKTIEPTESIITDDPGKIDIFFDDAVQRGLEGIIAKDLNAKYIAGARKFAWIKLKRSYKGELNDSVDVVVIGYFKGKGQRTKFGLGALLTAVYDKDSDMFRSVAKVGTGLSEEMLQKLEKMLSRISSKKRPARVDSGIEPDLWVEPRYVIEVVADEITKSPLHACGKEKEEGYALRFPRMVSLRSDKTPEQATETGEIIKMYKQQKRVSTEENDKNAA